MPAVPRLSALLCLTRHAGPGSRPPECPACPEEDLRQELASLSWKAEVARAARSRAPCL